jgi:hypothetical protein
MHEAPVLAPTLGGKKKAKSLRVVNEEASVIILYI